VQGADAAPTSQVLAAVTDLERQLRVLLANWGALSAQLDRGRK